MTGTSPSSQPGIAAGGKTILVVEDDVLIRLDTADALRVAGYVVLEAAHAEEAKVLLATFPEIAVVFSDIQMPGAMDGIALAEFVRAAYPAIRILLTSGRIARPAEADPAILFIPKPYNLDDVARRIADALKP